MSSSVKSVALVATAGALLYGGYSAYRGNKARKVILSDAEQIAKANNGKIPTGGRTKDGKMWDGFTTVEDIKKDSKKKLAFGVAVNAVTAFVSTAVVGALTLLAKSHIK